MNFDSSKKLAEPGVESSRGLVSSKCWPVLFDLERYRRCRTNYRGSPGCRTRNATDRLLVDFEFWARKNIGDEAVEYLKKNVHPLDLVFRLAESHGIVALNGGGFDAPDWSLRVSLANLSDEVYEEIARGIRSIARGYRDAFEAAKKAEGNKQKVA